MAIFLLSIDFLFAQEWKNLKSYQIETGNSTIQEGCWLKKDRRKQNKVWRKANLYNLSTKEGYLKYKTISQIRDFYLWFDYEREVQGHEIKSIGIASIVAGQLSKLDCALIRLLFIRNKEVVKFANEGSKKVFEFAFPLLKQVYFSNDRIRGKDADKWSLEYGLAEQCIILDPLYKKLSNKSLLKLDRMAKGKGIFKLVVPKDLRYIGKIDDCQDRYKHGLNTVLPFYLKNHSRNKMRRELMYAANANSPSTFGLQKRLKK